ncbi:hypothetical protein L917_20711 [Phytophthora nicotianae]|nr:hypothetical protein L917_20711 [Phytophthora nicotianae]
MRALVTSGHTFNNFPCALYATDVTFQQSNRPSGSMAEAMPFYSAKHKFEIGSDLSEAESDTTQMPR